MAKTKKPRGKHVTAAGRESLARFQAAKKFDIRFWEKTRETALSAISFLLKKKVTDKALVLLSHQQEMVNIADERLALARKGILLPVKEKAARVDRTDTISVTIRGQEKVLPAY